MAVGAHSLDRLVTIQHRGHDVDNIDIDRVGDSLRVGGGRASPAGGGALVSPHLPGLTLLVGEVSRALSLHNVSRCYKLLSMTDD